MAAAGALTVTFQAAGMVNLLIMKMKLISLEVLLTVFATYHNGFYLVLCKGWNNDTSAANGPAATGWPQQAPTAGASSMTSGPQTGAASWNQVPQGWQNTGTVVAKRKCVVSQLISIICHCVLGAASWNQPQAAGAGRGVGGGGPWRGGGAAGR